MRSRMIWTLAAVLLLTGCAGYREARLAGSIPEEAVARLPYPYVFDEQGPADPAPDYTPAEVAAAQSELAAIARAQNSRITPRDVARLRLRAGELRELLARADEAERRIERTGKAINANTPTS